MKFGIVLWFFRPTQIEPFAGQRKLVVFIFQPKIFLPVVVAEMEFVTEKRKSKSKTRDEAVEDDGERRQRMIDGSRSKDESADMAEDEDELVFEDPFGDEFEEEEIDGGEVEEAEDDEGHEDAMESGSGPPQDESTADVPKQLWRPGVDHIGEEEELEYDPSAYIMYHSMRTEWPCLSFDVLKDDMGDNRQRVSLITFSQIFK